MDTKYFSLLYVLVSYILLYAWNGFGFYIVDMALGKRLSSLGFYAYIANYLVGESLVIAILLVHALLVTRSNRVLGKSIAFIEGLQGNLQTDMKSKVSKLKKIQKFNRAMLGLQVGAGSDVCE